MFSDFLEDLRRPDIKEKPWMGDVELILGTTENITQAIDECIASEFYGCDIETTGLDSRVFGGRTVDSIVGIGIAPTEEKAYYFPVGHKVGAEHNIPWSILGMEFARLFHHEVKANPVFHNASFDLEFLDHNGFFNLGAKRFNNGKLWEDSIILAYLLNPREKGGRGLKALSKKLCGMEMIELNELIPDSKVKDYSTLDPSWRPSVLYAGADPLCTLRVFNILYKEYTETPHQTLSIYNLEKSCLVSVRWMHRCRVHIDVKKTESFIKEGHGLWWDSLLKVYSGAKDILGRDITPNFLKIMKGELKGEWEFEPLKLEEGYSYKTCLDEARKEAKRLYPDPVQTISKVVNLVGKEGTEKIEFPMVYDIMSPQKLGLLFRELNIPNLVLSEKSGQVKTGAEILDEVIDKSSEDFPFMEKMKKLRNFSRALGQYLIPFLEDRGRDGTLKPSFKQFSADTGRFSCKTTKKPWVTKDGGCRVPFQGIPATYDSSKPRIINKMRSCIDVRNSENWLVAIDYAGVELRLVTNLSKEPKWIKAFYQCSECGQEIDQEIDEKNLPKPTPPFCTNCGSDKIGDLHSITAVAFYGEGAKKDPRWKVFRGNGKQCNFSLCYGGTGRAVQRSIKGCSAKEGEEKYKKFTTTYTTLTRWWSQQQRFGKKHQFVSTAFGRVQPLPEIKSEDYRRKSKDERKAVNGPIQGTSADITKLAMALIYKAVEKKGWFSKLSMILTVHDEIVFEIHSSILEEAIEMISEIMVRNKAIANQNWIVPLLVDVEIGKQWDVPYDLNDIKTRSAGEKILKSYTCEDCGKSGKIKEEEICKDCQSSHIKYKYSEEERTKTQQEVDELYAIFKEVKEVKEDKEDKEEIDSEEVRYELEKLTKEEASNLVVWLNKNKNKNTSIFYEGRNINALL